MAVGGNLVWVTDSLDDTVVPVEPGTGRVLPPIPVGRGPAGVAVGDRAVWVANAIDGNVPPVRRAETYSWPNLVGDIEGVLRSALGEAPQAATG